jgi:hypothetical protein
MMLTLSYQDQMEAAAMSTNKIVTPSKQVILPHKVDRFAGVTVSNDSFKQQAVRDDFAHLLKISRA